MYLMIHHVFREVIPGLRAGLGKSSATNSLQSAGRHDQAIGADRKQRSRLDRSATRVKGPRYPGASPWTTLYINTAILNSILSGGRAEIGGRPTCRRCGRIAAGDRSTRQMCSAQT